MNIRLPLLTAMLTLLACTVASVLFAGSGGEIVALGVDEPEPASDDFIPANSIFQISSAEAKWRNAYSHSVKRAANRNDSPGHARTAALREFEKSKGFSFKKGTGFRSERFARKGANRKLIFRLTALEATRFGSSLQLKNLRLIVHFSGSTLAEASDKPSTQFSSMPSGTMELIAEKGLLNADRQSGRAEGGVTIKFFLDGPSNITARKPAAVLSCPKLRWHAWSVPETGAFEMSLSVTKDHPGEQEPFVKAHFTSLDSEGPPSTIDITANGMIFESSVLDHFKDLGSSPGNVSGKTNVAKRRILFHQNIKMTVKGQMAAALAPFRKKATPVNSKKQKEEKKASKRNTSKKGKRKVDEGTPLATRFEFLNGVAMRKEPLNPITYKPYPKASSTQGSTIYMQCQHLLFQFPPLSQKKSKDANSAKTKRGAKTKSEPKNKEKAKTEGPTLTRVACNGPAILDLAAPPRKLAPRPKGSPTGKMFPEYAEAVGGVHLEGLWAKSTEEAKAQKPSKPFTVDAQRVYFDGLSSTVNISGMPGSPLELVDEIGELYTQRLIYNQVTEVLSMPLNGPKKLIIHPSALSSMGSGDAKTDKQPKIKNGIKTSDAANPLFSGDGKLTINWLGTFDRKVVNIPTKPGQPISKKEILTFKRKVRVQQDSKDGKGLDLAGEIFQIILDVQTKTIPPKKGSKDEPKVVTLRRLERVAGMGQIRTHMQGMDLSGESLNMEIGYAPNGKINSNLITIGGGGDAAHPAFVRMGGNAIRGQRILFNGMTQGFEIPQGAVGLAQMPAPKKDPANYFKPKKKEGGMLAAMPMKFEGQIGFQCDGPLTYDPAAGRLSITKNVMIKQPGFRLITDLMYLNFTLPDKKAAKPKKDAAPGLFSGGLKSVQCNGHVEVMTPKQVIHCDQFHYDIVQEKGFLAAKTPDEVLNIYIAGPSNNTKLLQVTGRLDIDGKSGTFDPGGRAYILLPYKEKQPLPPGKVFLKKEQAK